RALADGTTAATKSLQPCRSSRSEQSNLVPASFGPPQRIAERAAGNLAATGLKNVELWCSSPITDRPWRLVGASIGPRVGRRRLFEFAGRCQTAPRWACVGR